MLLNQVRRLLSQRWFAVALEHVCAWSAGGGMIFLFFYVIR